MQLVFITCTNFDKILQKLFVELELLNVKNEFPDYFLKVNRVNHYEVCFLISESYEVFVNLRQNDLVPHGLLILNEFLNFLVSLVVIGILTINLIENWFHNGVSSINSMYDLMLNMINKV